MTVHVKYTFDCIKGGNDTKCGAVNDRLVLKEHSASLSHTYRVHKMHEAIPTGMWQYRTIRVATK